MEQIYIISGKRTAFGAFGGLLKNISGTDLGVFSAKAAIEQAQISPQKIDHCIIGNVVQSASDAAYLPRHIALKSGIPIEAGALAVNRLCGSGFQSWISAAQMIWSGESECVLAGGVEQMSQVPYVARKVRFDGMRMGNFELEDYLTSALLDSFAQIPMAITAENLGQKYGVTRDECDEYAYQSQMRYKEALSHGVFEREISPITIENKKGSIQVHQDEHPKLDATLEKIKSLKSIFKKDGLVTAGNASGIVDGSASSILVSESKCKALGLKPLARIVSYATVGCDPSIMGIGPVAASRLALKKAGLNLDQMDLIEVNEAFAAQFLAVKKELNLPNDRTNVNGGAIALGHPLAASGTRIMNHLVYELHRRQGRYALGSACIGGGQGIAILIEKI